MNQPLLSNDKTPLRVHVRDGLSQERRALPALAADYFNLDELSFTQLLCLLQDYAKLVTAPGLEPDERAQALLFSQNELMVMANILCLDTQALEHEFQQLQRSYSPEQLTHNPAVATPLGLLVQLGEWFTQLRHPQSNAGEQIYKLLESILVGMRQDLQPLLGQVSLLSQQKSPELSVDDSAPVISSTFNQLLVITPTSNDEPIASDSSEPDLECLQVSLLKAINLLQRDCEKYLLESLHCQFHDPALAIRVIFVELYQKLQTKLNRFTLDFVDFYFTQVLQTKARSLVADSVYLVLHPNQKQKTLQIAQGEEFFAGLDDQSRDIIYRADNTTEINDAQVVRIHSLYFPRSPLAGNEARTLANGCWLDTIASPPDADAKLPSTPSAKPLFGAARDTHAANSASSASLGFALANKILLLREGARKITLNLLFQDIPGVSWSRLKRMLRDLPGNSRGNNNEKAKFFNYFSDMFCLSITTAKGWYNIEEYKPSYSAIDINIKPNCLTLSFHLTEAVPAICAYDASIHGDNFDTQVPVLKVLLKDNYVQYPYDLLKDLVLREVRIDVEVSGYQDLLVHNKVGQVSTLAPFTPFGPLADQGSYFIVGAEELCHKQLTRLSFDLEWNGLPTNAGGFGHWYQGYEHIKNTRQFVVSASLLVDGRWQPSAKASGKLQPLFSSHVVRGTEQIIEQQQLDASGILNYLKPQEPQPADATFNYNTQTRNGLFKFTLQGPSGGFGQREYSQLLSATLTYNGRVKNEHLLRPLPNPPYTPELASIRVNYSATSLINLNEPDKLSNPKLRDQFIHLHPLGWETISPLRHPKIYLLPQYKDAGNFIIGIKASDAEQVNLFFHLYNNSLPMDAVGGTTDAATIHPATTQEPLKWSYLVENQWRPLASHQLLSDSTHNFKVSGIINLQLPRALTTNNTRLSAGLLWLKVSANLQLENFSHIHTVYAQAIKATWASGDHPAAAQPMMLKAGTITRSRQSLSGIAAVTQVCSSFNGVPAETAAGLRQRMSERLRHKQRALTPMDYEMLILERFPQVFKVKCFANVRSQDPSRLYAGHLLIIPIPYLPPGQELNFQPHFDGYLIETIAKFVRELAPAFSHIAVENPVYEAIQIRCAVHIKAGYPRGESQNQLNRQLCEFISPWHSDGNRVHFGWSINEQEIKSFIHNLDYIDHVTDFSVLRIAPSGSDFYSLDDTANSDNSTAKSGRINPSYLWSCAVPFNQHYLQSLADKAQIIAEVTGYDELEIGSNFIIS